MINSRLFTVLYFSVRSSRSIPSALRYGQLSWMSVKTTQGAVLYYGQSESGKCGKSSILVSSVSLPQGTGRTESLGTRLQCKLLLATRRLYFDSESMITSVLALFSNGDEFKGPPWDQNSTQFEETSSKCTFLLHPIDTRVQVQQLV